MLCYFWNNFCDNLPNLHMVNRNWKFTVRCATLSTRCHKEHKREMDVLIHSDPWSLFIMAIVKQIFLFNWKILLTLPNNVQLFIIYVLLHLSPEYCLLSDLNVLHKQRKSWWEFIIEHVDYTNFGTQDNFTSIIFGIDIKYSCISSL